MSFSAFDHQCMALALELAAHGMDSTHPNPRVGCVIARDGCIIATGWHVRAGAAHAEVLALGSAGSKAAGSTVYVTLEPCNHHGRTPPCVDALLAAGISRVVCAIEDPNNRVNGAGRRRLQDAGVQVDCGLMQAAAEELNAGFLMRMRSGRPWVRVKMASSLDGRTALRNGQSQWISSEASRSDVQTWRARSSALLTGIGTVLADNPRLTARAEQSSRVPLRIVMDSRWRTPPASRLLEDASTAIIIGSDAVGIPASLNETGAHCLAVPEADGKVDLEAALQGLGKLELNEVQVEAGATLCGALLGQHLVDEILLYQAPVLLGDEGAGLFSMGVLESMNEKIPLDLVESCWLGSDLRLRLRPVYPKTGKPQGSE